MRKTAIIIMLVLIAIGSTYWFWLRPSAEPEYSYVVMERRPMTDDPPAGAPPSRYVMVKQEIKDWIGIIGKLVPMVSLLLAFLIKKRKA